VATTATDDDEDETSNESMEYIPTLPSCPRLRHHNVCKYKVKEM